MSLSSGGPLSTAEVSVEWPTVTEALELLRFVAARFVAMSSYKSPLKAPDKAVRSAIMEDLQSRMEIRTQMNPHILVVDDDPEIRTLLGRYLTERGFRVSVAGSGEELRHQIAALTIDLIVLDILLPDGSGLELCRELSTKHSLIPIILLTALKEDVDRIIGLELGADDYLGKPFNPRELVARIRTILRRSDTRSSAVPSRTFSFSGFNVDCHTRTVTSPPGAAITLTAGEFDLLVAFLERPGTVLSRDQLLEWTQNKDSDPYDRSIDVLVSRLRRKLGGSGNGAFFKTVRNGGYLFTPRVQITGHGE
jgi:two-component system, OmpR family, response regulator